MTIGEEELLAKYEGSSVALAVAFIEGTETSMWASRILTETDLIAARYRIELKLDKEK